MIFTLTKLEWERWFKTGKIWKFLGVCQLILGLIFYWLLEQYLQENQSRLLESSVPFGITEEVVHPLFAWTALLFFIITPLLVSKSLTEERKNHTLELYFTAAIPPRDLVLGKFLGITILQLFLILPTVLMPLLIMLHNHLDLGQYCCGLLGLVFLLTANSCLALYIASYCKEPLVATFITVMLLLFLSLLEWIPRFFGQGVSWLSEFALLYHCQNFLSGLIDTKDIVYFSLFAWFFLYLTIRYLSKTSGINHRT